MIRRTTTKSTTRCSSSQSYFSSNTGSSGGGAGSGGSFCCCCCWSSGRHHRGTNRTIWAGRILFWLCLIMAAIALGYFAHTIISNSEHQLAQTQFNAIADHALDQAADVVLTKTLGSRTMATILSHRFPNLDEWPFVTLEGYEDIAEHLIETSKGRGMGFVPFVQPSEVQEFEDFAYQYFNTTFPNDPNLGVSAFGKGIYGYDMSINTTDHRFWDTTGHWLYDENQANSSSSSQEQQHMYLAPMIQHNAGNSSVLMRNIRNDRKRGNDIDKMMDCFQHSKKKAADNEGPIHPEHQPECGYISSYYLARSDGQPSAFIYQPIVVNTEVRFLITSTPFLSHKSDAILNIDSLLLLLLPYPSL